jgi:class 3 adenylate cyclase
MGGGRLLQPGTRLGPYRVEAFLARGSSGEVYRATDERLGRSAAVKVLPPWLGEDARVRDRFLAEARAAASLDHPNVLPVYDAGDEDGTLWIAMRLAEGRDLRELLRRDGPLPPERAAALLAGIAAALDAAHARGMLHRDVKPGNILLGPDASSDHAYLADFGLATAAHGRGLTRTGEVLGTIDYVSPEQARGEPLDARSDVWSLAAVLYESLTGEPPFRRDTEVAALTARLEGTPPAPTSLRPGLPEALDPVLARGLARDPAERYPSAGALLGAATAAVHGARLRGILFADLRGYTAFAEREGDARASALLARYRDLVRVAVARTGGAEIRTEGDSFYVVFPSATAAIRAGLAIAAAAAAATEHDSSLPIRPGVGVHAGEPLEAPEGPIGAAVNTAARLCSLAEPGEVLVSATARDLAAGARDLTFASRGRLAAKGLAEPVEAWAATSATGPAVPLTPEHEPLPGARGRRRSAVAAVAIIGLGAVLVVGVALAGRGTPPASPSATLGVGVAGAVPSGAAAGSGSPPANASPSQPSGVALSPDVGASPTLGLFPTDAEAALLAALPVGLVGRCERGARIEDAVLAGFEGKIRDARPVAVGAPLSQTQITPRPVVGLTCRPDAGARRLYVMQPARSPDADPAQPEATGDTYVNYLAARWKIADGSCADGRSALERWRERQGTGLLACLNPYDGRPWIYFSFGKGRYLGFATRDDADYGALYAWWDQLKTFLP